MKCLHPIQLIIHFHPTLLNLYHSPSNTMAWIVVLRLFKGTLTSTIAFDNGKGPFPCFLLLQALIKAMENHLIHTHTTPFTHFGYVCVGERLQIVNYHYYCHVAQMNPNSFFVYSWCHICFHPNFFLLVGLFLHFACALFSRDSHGFTH